jgi:hypothetical protein
VTPCGIFEFTDENEIHALDSPRVGKEKDKDDTEYTPNFVPKMDNETAPVQGKLAR